MSVSLIRVWGVCGGGGGGGGVVRFIPSTFPLTHNRHRNVRKKYAIIFSIFCIRTNGLRVVTIHSVLIVMVLMRALASTKISWMSAWGIFVISTREDRRVAWYSCYVQ